MDITRLHQAFKILKTDHQIEELYQEANLFTKRIAFSMVKDQQVAEDISQEIFTKLLTLPVEKLPSQKEISWLYTVVKNECFLYFRKQKITTGIEDIYEIPEEKEELSSMIERVDFNKLIENLPEIEKQILSLKFISDFTFQEISKLLEMPIGTVQWRYYKAIHSLKAILSSFTGSIITFLIGIGLWRSSNKKAEESDIMEESKNIIQEDTNQYISNGSNHYRNEMEKQNEINQPSVSNQIEGQNVIEKDMINQNYNTQVVIGTFTISLILFLLSIFFIFMKKYQQKENKKSSNKKQM